MLTQVLTCTCGQVVCEHLSGQVLWATVWTGCMWALFWTGCVWAPVWTGCVWAPVWTGGDLAPFWTGCVWAPVWTGCVWAPVWTGRVWKKLIHTPGWWKGLSGLLSRHTETAFFRQRVQVNNLVSPELWNKDLYELNNIPFFFLFSAGEQVACTPAGESESIADLQDSALKSGISFRRFSHIPSSLKTKRSRQLMNTSTEDIHDDVISTPPLGQFCWHVTYIEQALPISSTIRVFTIEQVPPISSASRLLTIQKASPISSTSTLLDKEKLFPLVLLAGYLTKRSSAH